MSGQGKWAQAGVPHKGWQFVDFEDLGEIDATCEMCETREIRYVHYLEHPEYPYRLGVGRVCAEHMEEDYVAAGQREKKASSIAGRRARWMKAEWRESERGNHYINRSGFNAVLYRVRGGWGYKIIERDSEKSWRGTGCSTEDEAKLAAFDRLIEVEDELRERWG